MWGVFDDPAFLGHSGTSPLNSRYPMKSGAFGAPKSAKLKPRVNTRETRSLLISRAQVIGTQQLT